MLPDYFDIHSHLNFPEYDTDREEVITKLAENKIHTITVGTGLETSKQAVDLANKHEHLFATIGVHPADHDGEKWNEVEYTKLINNKKVVAIGECGLDYFRLPVGKEEEKKKEQKEAFEQQIAFAVQHDRPLMIHCRDAYPDVLDILASKKKEYGDKLRGNFHFFTSPVEIARKCLEVGFTVSFTGPITYGSQYDEVVAFIPLEKMMSETDAPFAAPVPHRGKRNEPLFVQEVVKKIALVKGQDLDSVRIKLVENAFDLFLKNS